ncbi:family 20 glycosylhydrolase [Kribbella sp. NPDC051936]|uniref:family 20 glycosylhydrolase n=1 Tax=Kribbella sp. NPDC051936 TaxID=3154946 RepID=UPI00342CFA55
MGGAYTKEDYAEPIRYAGEHYVTEIDTQGHTNAALASYPGAEQGDLAPDLYTETEAGFSSLALDTETAPPEPPATWETLGRGARRDRAIMRPSGWRPAAPGPR